MGRQKVSRVELSSGIKYEYLAKHACDLSLIWDYFNFSIINITDLRRLCEKSVPILLDKMAKKSVLVLMVATTERIFH